MGLVALRGKFGKPRALGGGLSAWEKREAKRLDADEELQDIITHRPKTRGDCIDGPRPCPWALCQYHLFVEVTPRRKVVGGEMVGGNLKMVFPGRNIKDLDETCALDVADRGGYTLDQVGLLMNVTRERVRQIQADALKRIRKSGVLDEHGNG